MSVIKKNFKTQYLFSEVAVLVYLSLFKLFIHLAVNLAGGYGFFRDEFYYLACSDHLDWGYVDQPSLSILLLRISRWILGDSLAAVRFLPAVAGAGAVLITGLMVKKMGGGRFAQVLACSAVIIAPLYLGTGSFFSMNSFDLLFWALAAYLLVLIFQDGDRRLWLLLGLVLGLGLNNKISVLWLIFGLAVGLILTSQRKSLLTPWPWLAGGIALLCFLPHLLWQMSHHWPTLEFIRNATSQKMVAVSPWEFLSEQVFLMHLFTLPVWLAGLLYFLLGKQGKKLRILGIIYVAVLLLLIFNQKSRPGYLAPAYAALFAAGAIVFENFLQRLNRKGLKSALLVLLVLGGMVTAPLALPVLPVEKYLRYAELIGQEPSTGENKEVGSLPQHYADMFGWDNMVAAIARVYQKLTPEEQSLCTIFTGNYGEAGAVDFLGRKYDLPRAISGHNNYWLWGPGETAGKVVIFFGGPSEEDLRKLFRDVEIGEVFTCRYCMPYENNTPIFLCKKPRVAIKMYWSRVKHFE